jgi:hypothetical protein
MLANAFILGVLIGVITGMLLGVYIGYRLSISDEAKSKEKVYKKK